jgi:hypothetical protein
MGRRRFGRAYGNLGIQVRGRSTSIRSILTRPRTRRVRARSISRDGPPSAGATVVYWYGFEEGESSTWAFPEIVLTPIGGAIAWCGYLLYPEPDFDSTIVGCGVVVVSDRRELPDRLEALGEGIVSIYCDAPLPSGGIGSVQFGIES